MDGRDQIHVHDPLNVPLPVGPVEEAIPLPGDARTVTNETGGLQASVTLEGIPAHEQTGL